MPSSQAGIGMIRTVVAHDDYADRYGAKLIKYIPAEVLAAFVPLVALAQKISPGPNGRSNDLWIWVTIGIGACCVVGYNRWQATDILLRQLQTVHGPNGPDHWSPAKIKREHDKLKPSWYFYFLALVAFGAWGLAIASPVRAVTGLSQAESEYIVAAATFILPLADATLAHFCNWLHGQQTVSAGGGPIQRPI